MQAQQFAASASLINDSGQNRVATTTKKTDTKSTEAFNVNEQRTHA